ncbi:MAG: MtrB/PioB family outer membrane beta-barrel protein [Rhodoferax sp.]
MKTHNKQFVVRASVLAAHAALVTLAMLPSMAQAQEATAAELTQSVSTVEVGVTSVDKDSYKFGEYNGLQKQGVSANLGLDVRGGSRYDSGGVDRYRISGQDLGLETRSLNLDFSEQGKFRFNLGYDELLRNRSDSYQTPLLGAGTNALTLPSNWVRPMQLNVNPNATTAVTPSVNALALDPNFINNDSVYRFDNAANAYSAGHPSAIYAPTAGQIAAMQAVAATDNADFQNVNLSTKRTKADIGFGVEVDDHWGVVANARQEFKKGLKPMSTISRNTGGDIAMVIPDLIDTRTDQMDVTLNYRDAHRFMSVNYYTSLFTNNVKSMSWENWATTDHTLNRMSSAPDNQFHQFSVTGGYDLTPSTKAVVSMTYGRSTQDDAFLTTGSELGSGVPQTSLGGLVVSRAFSAKLHDKTTPNLALTAAYKFDERDNQTAVNNYVFYDPGETKSGTSVFNTAHLGWTPTGGDLGSAANINANRPYSKRTNQLNLDADYKVAQGQAVKVGVDVQKVDRYCNGTWIDCVDAATTNENTLRAEIRSALSEDLNAKLGYSFSSRTVGNYNSDAFLALVPMANQIPSNAPAGLTVSAYQAMLALGLTGNGVWMGYPTPSQLAAMTPAQLFYFGGSTANPSVNASGGTTALSQALYGNVNRISELAGMRRFNMADRDRNKLRSSLNWQASERFSLQGGVDYSNDNYANSQYGLNKAQNAAINIDGVYNANENTSFGFFVSTEEQRSTSAGNSLATNNNGTGSNAYVGQSSNTAIVGNASCGVVNGVTLNTIALRNQNNRIDPCNEWSADMRDHIDTLGLNFTQKGLWSGKLDLTTELVFSSAKSDIAVTGGSYVNNPASVNGSPAGTTAAFYIPASAFPTVTSNTVEVKVKGRYAFDKSSTMRVSYTYAQTKVVDWSFDSMQTGATGSGFLPTNELAPNFTVQTLGASYVYTF